VTFQKKTHFTISHFIVETSIAKTAIAEMAVPNCPIPHMHALITGLESRNCSSLLCKLHTILP